MTDAIGGQVSRRAVMAAGGAALLGARLPAAVRPAAPDPLTALGAADAARRIRAGTLTSVALTRAYLARIAIYNPKLSAIITVAEGPALATAAACDAETARGRSRGPLHGVPILLKDNIDTAGIRTTAASLVYDNRVPTADAEVTRRLTAAGAVMLGKANMHEFAGGITSASSYFRPVRNPWALDRDAAGSSSGSAAAISADLACAALRLGVLAGYDRDDIASVEHPAEDYVAALSQPIAALRLGVVREPYFDLLDEDVARVVAAAIARLTGLMASATTARLPDTNGFGFLGTAEIEAYHRELFRDRPWQYGLHFRNVLKGDFDATDDTHDKPAADKVVDYVRASWALQKLRRETDAIFAQADILALPTMRRLPRPLAEVVAREEKPEPLEPEINENCIPFNILGLPAISVPAGFSRDGLPIGLMLAAPRFAEGRLLAVAHAFEQATPWHLRRPALRPDMPVPPLAWRT